MLLVKAEFSHQTGPSGGSGDPRASWPLSLRLHRCCCVSPVGVPPVWKGLHFPLRRQSQGLGTRAWRFSNNCNSSLGPFEKTAVYTRDRECGRRKANSPPSFWGRSAVQIECPQLESASASTLSLTFRLSRAPPRHCVSRQVLCCVALSSCHCLLPFWN